MRVGLQNEELQRIRHDLRAPLINIQGFASELGDAMSKLTALVDAQKHVLPVDFSGPACGLIDEDIVPCLGYLGSSVIEMDRRLDELTTITNVGKPAD